MLLSWITTCFRRLLPASNLLLIALLSAGLSGCESDPVLAPATEEEEATGSYGLSHFPGDRTDDADHKESNPELF